MAQRSRGSIQSKHKWTRQALLAKIRQYESGKITSPLGHKQSASPQITTQVPDNVFEVSHRLSVDGRWAMSETTVAFRFTRAKGGYFHVELLGFRPVSAA